MTAVDISVLEASVEALIQQQVSAYEAQLREALAATLSKTTRSKPSKRPAKSTSAARRSPAAPRRTPEEIEALAERFYAAVEAEPGETMVTYSAKLGLSSPELERPVLNLRKAKRIRSVGERSRTRYFAMVPRTGRGDQAVTKSDGAGSSASPSM